MRLDSGRAVFRAACAAAFILALAACGGGGGKKSGGAGGCGGVPDPASAITAPAVAAGNNHSVALRSDGTVCSWGANAFGQLGDGSASDRSSPVGVSGLSGVIAIASGNNHSLAVKEDGTVWAWGSNTNGQLGDGTTFDSAVPVRVLGLGGAVGVAAGDSFSLAVLSDGTVRAWGKNSNGQLGNGSAPIDSHFPVAVANLPSIVAVAAGGLHGLALDDSGGVWAWGFNPDGQLGNGTTALTQSFPSAVLNLTSVIAIAGGNTHSLGLRSDGTVWAWGDNTHGQLGIGTAGIDQPVPVQVLSLSGISAVAAGFTHSLAVKTDGTVFAWGSNFFGQLGVGNFSDSSAPLQSAGVGDGIVVAGGGSHSLAVEGSGSVWAWGDNQSGQSGDGTFSGPEPLPVRVVDLNL